MLKRCRRILEKYVNGMGGGGGGDRSKKKKIARSFILISYIYSLKV